MKVRQGFVSNSSSSSFIVAVPSGAEVTTDSIMELFEIPQTSPVYGLNCSIAEFIARSVVKTDIPDMLHNYGYDSVAEAEEDGCCGELQVAVDYASSGFDIYYLHASDDNGDGIETMLCNTELDIRTDNLAIVGGGGY